MSLRVPADAESAVREVYDAHYGRLVGWAAKLVGDVDLAHDFVSESFIQLLRRWGSVHEPRPWLYAAVTNQVRDHWRRRGREASAYDRWQVSRNASTEADESGPDQALRLSVRDAVTSLPDRLRAVVLLYYYADLSVAQVARSTGKSEGAVKRDLYDARQRLASSLEGVR